MKTQTQLLVVTAASFYSKVANGECLTRAERTYTEIVNVLSDVLKSPPPIELFYFLSVFNGS
jgi:hypothetical protein